MVVDPEAPHKGRNAAHLVQPFLIRGDLEVADIAKTRWNACLLLQMGIEIPSVGVDGAFSL